MQSVKTASPWLLPPCWPPPHAVIAALSAIVKATRLIARARVLTRLPVTSRLSRDGSSFLDRALVLID
jgi:hypothetical protein